MLVRTFVRFVRWLVRSALCAALCAALCVLVLCALCNCVFCFVRSFVRQPCALALGVALCAEQSCAFFQMALFFHNLQQGKIKKTVLQYFFFPNTRESPLLLSIETTRRLCRRVVSEAYPAKTQFLKTLFLISLFFKHPCTPSNHFFATQTFPRPPSKLLQHMRQRVSLLKCLQDLAGSYLEARKNKTCRQQIKHETDNT